MEDLNSLKEECPFLVMNSTRNVCETYENIFLRFEQIICEIQDGANPNSFGRELALLRSDFAKIESNYREAELEDKLRYQSRGIGYSCGGMN